MELSLAVTSAATVAPVRAERIEPQIADEELLRRLAEGDEWAKEALYRRYVRLVWGTALRLMGCSSEAEDLVQDTFVEALRDLPKVRKVEALKGWLLQVTVHQAHRRFRKRRALRRLGLSRAEDDAPLATLVAIDASPEVYAELRQVDRALAELPTGERFAWILRYVDGHSLEEVAACCDCSLATIKRRLLKANACVERYRRSDGGRHG